MHILLTNDDGIYAPGLAALAEEMNKLGKVSVLAPDRNWSASGHVKTIDRPLRVKEVRLSSEISAWSSDGAPSDCVALAVCGFIQQGIDLVVSGINPHANLGHDVTYSGTVAAAMEAAIWGYPAIAVSLESPESLVGTADYRASARVARIVAQSVLQYGLASDVFLNVNVPYLLYEELKGFYVARQGLRVYHDKLDQRVDPRGKPYFWTAGDLPTGIPERGTDIGALAEGFVSITPLHLDLTAYSSVQELDSWDWKMDDLVEFPEFAETGMPVFEVQTS